MMIKSLPFTGTFNLRLQGSALSQNSASATDAGPANADVLQEAGDPALQGYLPTLVPQNDRGLCTLGDADEPAAAPEDAAADASTDAEPLATADQAAADPAQLGEAVGLGTALTALADPAATKQALLDGRPEPDQKTLRALDNRPPGTFSEADFFAAGRTVIDLQAKHPDSPMLMNQALAGIADDHVRAALQQVAQGAATDFVVDPKLNDRNEALIGAALKGLEAHKLALPATHKLDAVQSGMDLPAATLVAAVEELTALPSPQRPAALQLLTDADVQNKAAALLQAYAQSTPAEGKKTLQKGAEQAAAQYNAMRGASPDLKNPAQQNYPIDELNSTGPGEDVRAVALARAAAQLVRLPEAERPLALAKIRSTELRNKVDGLMGIYTPLKGPQIDAAIAQVNTVGSDARRMALDYNQFFGKVASAAKLAG